MVPPEDVNAAKVRGTRWLSQICEYWPLERLAGLTDDDIRSVLESYINANNFKDLLPTLALFRIEAEYNLSAPALVIQTS